MKLSKAYEPKQYEDDIYTLWEKSEAFAPKNRGSSDAYSIVMPPPNANGNLHIGHALTFALEDIAVRYHRLKGESALLLPGADHAGFETQVVYEKQLAKEGKSRFDLSREELYTRIWDFVQLNKHNSEEQIRRLGISCDWSRHTFTLDPKIINRAYATFKKMWDDKLVYRGERLVNFCTFHGTAFADIEVEHKEEQGHIWEIKYPLTDGNGEITVATTRPETMLGDTAVAVNPTDDRYKHLVGKTVKLPLTNREIPIIADDFVDKEFGTGAVKITPAHDPNDYEAGKRHDLPMISVIDHEGKMTHDVPAEYRGLSVKDAREKVVKDLEKQGNLGAVTDHTHSVGHCYKCGTVIQPLLREQWFVDMQPLAKEAIKALKADKIAFYPAAKKDQLITYLEGLRDWNISRQIAWGIPIPAFQNIEDHDDWIFDERVNEQTIVVDGKTYARDPDVFDTWFSSSSWPYATLNYPDGEDYQQFYPISVMETGGEILYPWVSRMIMLGLYVTGNVPFESVYVHGYVLAADGSKMSKSVGNVINPIEVIDQYGSDALRMGIVAGRAPAVNRGYDPSKVEGARNFANKLWNIARFAEDKVRDKHNHVVAPHPQTNADHWILSKLQHSTEVISAHLDNYRFAEAYEELYRLVWDELADWYLEASKSKPNTGVLMYALDTILKLAHPFAPFVTETIWQTLPWTGDSLLITNEWPKPVHANTAAAKEFEEVMNIVSEIRSISTALHLRGISLYHSGEHFIAEQALLLKQLARLDTVSEVEAGQGLYLTATKHRAWLDIDHDTIASYSKELKAKQEAQAKVVANLEARLGNKSYTQNAPHEVVQQTKDQLKEAQTIHTSIQAEIKRFSTL